MIEKAQKKDSKRNKTKFQNRNKILPKFCSDAREVAKRSVWHRPRVSRGGWFSQIFCVFSRSFVCLQYPRRLKLLRYSLKTFWSLLPFLILKLISIHLPLRRTFSTINPCSLVPQSSPYSPGNSDTTAQRHKYYRIERDAGCFRCL